MQHDFWQARWARNEIGFHQGQVNPGLARHWPTLQLAPDTQVLVPLCGKSLDMLWLAEQGYRVLGVELAERAVVDFFASLGVEPSITEEGPMRRYCHERLEILQGDFFDTAAEHLAGCAALYDRAALIALPHDMRVAYAAHLQRTLPSTLAGLLVTLEYPQAEMDGPPFAVPADEVRRHFVEPWQVDEVERLDVLAENPKFLKRGVSRLDEVVFRLRRG
ncbi:thiopurine S-methyltransferase [Pseudomonas sp. ZM23]|uniref:Thiopurine S-methyltransferase n=1 Tax=Pseudomonas triclosanedens TaxID=2961893 RepID=A0ABY6ZSS9_9PSED|nr:thiopurine S-methyltransferase [Pseudomonas triclosanedens]MCP8467286.1 thiopurine S-methyltransferase [Pseudomonas triclosanedens]MCP8472613.1 thiopurine S-methyltransferase [Pseudomonas triclosanedens]MCP8478674.1 thiopurine S-methyltransferase [Pseudomonas triclosanedens]WAI47849.1 thiopurine S-methyltransferase [Pseudomonas triclosanedens]